MSLHKIKNYLLSPFVPLMRLYIRYSPILIGKYFLWETFWWRNKHYTAYTYFGSKMAGESRDMVQGYIYYFGIWEPNLTRVVQSRLSGLRDRTFVDVGANVGYFTLLGAQSMPEGQVISVEAFPSIYDRLQDNINLNAYSNVRTVNCAATESVQKVSMYHAGVGNEGATTSMVGKFKAEPTVVDGQPLSDILTQAEIKKIRLIKIDVEGAEHAVIKGMSTFFNQLPLDAEIVVEVTPAMLNEQEMVDIFSIFETQGFFPYVLPNCYDPKYYMMSQKTSNPVRMQSFPVEQTDIVFSKLDEDELFL